MDIGALSIALSQASLAQEISTKVLDMSLEQSKQQGQNLITKMLGTSLDPNLGTQLDIRV